MTANQIHNGPGEPVDDPLDVDLGDLGDLGDDITDPPLEPVDDPVGPPPARWSERRPSVPQDEPVTWLTAAKPPADEPTGPTFMIDSQAAEAPTLLAEDDGEEEYLPPLIDKRAVTVCAGMVAMWAAGLAFARVVVEAFPPLDSLAGVAVLTMYGLAVLELGRRAWRYEPVVDAWLGTAALLTVCACTALALAAVVVVAVIALFS